MWLNYNRILIVHETGFKWIIKGYLYLKDIFIVFPT